MRKLALITLIFLSASYVVKSQTGTPAISSYAFIVDNPTENGKIKIEDNSGYIFGSLAINIYKIKSSFQYATTNFAIIDGQDVLFAVDGPTFNKDSDFHNDSELSEAKDFNFNIPPSVMTRIFSPTVQLVVRYKFRYNGSSIWNPMPEENVGEYYTDSYRYGFVQVSSFSGPDHICDEGTYTITRPGIITLEGGNGIATLTHLGNNQWKVERINNAVGTVVLKSLVGSNAYEKTIRIGTDTPISITGNSYSLDWSRSYTFTVNTEDANSILEIEKQGAPSVTFTRLDNNRFRLSTPPKPSSNAPITPIYVLNIRARVLDPECGNSEYIHQEIRVGTTIPFE